MREARLVGLSQDGTRLVLAVAETGEEFAVDVDDRLRAALRGDRARLGQLEIQMDSALRPRDIQARIRAGESPEAVAAVAGMPMERVMAFAGPVLAERDHVANLAQRASVRRRGAGDAPTRNLGVWVTERLRLRGVDPTGAEWDAWRREDGRWAVRVSYRVAGDPATAEPDGDGKEEAEAMFAYDAPGRYAVPDDDEARWLVGEQVQVVPPQPQPGRRLTAVADIDHSLAPDHGADSYAAGFEDTINLTRNRQFGRDQQQYDYGPDVDRDFGQEPAGRPEPAREPSRGAPKQGNPPRGPWQNESGPARGSWPGDAAQGSQARGPWQDETGQSRTAPGSGQGQGGPARGPWQGEAGQDEAGQRSQARGPWQGETARDGASRESSDGEADGTGRRDDRRSGAEAGRPAAYSERVPGNPGTTWEPGASAGPGTPARPGAGRDATELPPGQHAGRFGGRPSDRGSFTGRTGPEQDPRESDRGDAPERPRRVHPVPNPDEEPTLIDVPVERPPTLRPAVRVERSTEPPAETTASTPPEEEAAAPTNRLTEGRLPLEPNQADQAGSDRSPTARPDAASPDVDRSNADQSNSGLPTVGRSTEEHHRDPAPAVPGRDGAARETTSDNERESPAERVGVPAPVARTADPPASPQSPTAPRLADPPAPSRPTTDSPAPSRSTTESGPADHPRTGAPATNRPRTSSPAADRPAARTQPPDEPAPMADPSTAREPGRTIPTVDPDRTASPGSGTPAADGPADPPPTEATEPEPTPEPPKKKPARRNSKRASVPSWDEIMFGKKAD